MVTDEPLTGGLVAALLDEPDYELADVETRLVARLRIAYDVRLLAEVDGRSSPSPTATRRTRSTSPQTSRSYVHLITSDSSR